MNFLKNLENLENRLHVLLLEHTQISEENLALKKEIHRLKEQNEKLSAEIQVFIQEKKSKQNLKHEILRRIQSIIHEIENGIPTGHSHTELTPEEISALTQEPSSTKKLAPPKIHFLADDTDSLYEKNAP